MKKYMITLASKKERSEASLTKFAEIGVMDIETIDGVDGSRENLDALGIRRSSFQRYWHNRFVCCSYHHSYTNSEFGCALSHLKIYEKILRDGDGTALIMEDDLVPADAERARAVMGSLDEFMSQSRCDIFFINFIDKLRPFRQKHLTVNGIGICSVGAGRYDWFFNRRKTVDLASGYIVTAKACGRLLELGRPASMPADRLTGLLAYTKLNAWRTEECYFHAAKDGGSVVHYYDVGS